MLGLVHFPWSRMKLFTRTENARADAACKYHFVERKPFLCHLSSFIQGLVCCKAPEYIKKDLFLIFSCVALLAKFISRVWFLSVLFHVFPFSEPPCTTLVTAKDCCLSKSYKNNFKSAIVIQN